MKSILMGGDKILEVFDWNTRETLIREAGLDCTPYQKEDILSSPEQFKDTEYIFSTWGMPAFSEEEIAQYLPSLKAVFYGAGTVKGFAREFLQSGVKIFSAWGANAVPVAEYTIAQIILANKGFYLASRRCTSLLGRGKSDGYFHTMPGNYGVRVGIIGAGMVGRLVLQMLKPYHLQVLVYDPFLSEENARKLGAKKASLEEIFETCQTISNHVANLPETVGMFDYRLFSRMKENAVFINTGRGAQVVEADLIRALEEKPDRTAVLDVTWPEPPVEGSQFYTLENVFLTPHIAGSAGLEVARMGEYMLEEFRKLESGEPCQYEVSLQMLETMA